MIDLRRPFSVRELYTFVNLCLNVQCKKHLNMREEGMVLLKLSNEDLNCLETAYQEVVPTLNQFLPISQSQISKMSNVVRIICKYIKNNELKENMQDVPVAVKKLIDLYTFQRRLEELEKQGYTSEETVAFEKAFKRYNV